MEFKGFDYIGHPSGRGQDSYQKFVCGFCGKPGTGVVVAFYKIDDKKINKWLMCPYCDHGSVLSHNGNIYPVGLLGESLKGLPDPIDDRRCLSANCFIATEMLCRKILMHVACEKGADEGKTFEYYIDYLEKKGFITPPIKKWVEIIREQGNEATHRLQKSDSMRSNGILTFTAQLLRIIYEMEYLAGKHLSGNGVNP